MPLLQVWAMGLVFLKIWARCVLLAGQAMDGRVANVNNAIINNNNNNNNRVVANNENDNRLIVNNDAQNVIVIRIGEGDDANENNVNENNHNNNNINNNNDGNRARNEGVDALPEEHDEVLEVREWVLRWNRRLNVVMRNGFRGMNFKHAFCEVCWPALYWCCTVLCPPYVIGFAVEALLGGTAPVAARLCRRYAYHVYQSYFAILRCRRMAIRAYRAFHDKLRDERYLMGRELQNS